MFMKKSKKYVLFMSFAMIILIPTMAYASASSYQSTYDMQRSVFSREITAKSYVSTYICPDVGTNGANMGIVWAKKYWYGWDGDMKTTDSTRPGSVTFKLKSKDTAHIWLRNFTKDRWSGHVTFTWN